MKPLQRASALGLVAELELWRAPQQKYYAGFAPNQQSSQATSSAFCTYQQDLREAFHLLFGLQRSEKLGSAGRGFLH